MQKQQFADQQAANQLSLKTNQFNLTQAQAKLKEKKSYKKKRITFANSGKVLRVLLRWVMTKKAITH